MQIGCKLMSFRFNASVLPCSTESLLLAFGQRHCLVQNIFTRVTSTERVIDSFRRHMRVNCFTTGKIVRDDGVDDDGKFCRE